MSENENKLMQLMEEKVIKLLETINSKLDKLLDLGAPATPSPSFKSGSTTIIEESGKKPSEIVDKQLEEERLREKPPVEGRRVCPQCGGTSFKEVEDRSQILHQMGGMKIYAKKHVCRNCGFEF
ncbi:MAG: hypothetical protein ACTSYC_08150 [Promethearchaeota archaeon]